LGGGGATVSEEEWLACADPVPMLDFLRGKVSDRKLRLFAAACCRRAWHLMPDPRSKQAVEWLEKYYDGGDHGALNRAQNLALAAHQAVLDANGNDREAHLYWDVQASDAVVEAACTHSANSAAYNAASHVATAIDYNANGYAYDSTHGATKRAEERAQAELLRHICNPWITGPPPTGLKAWLAGWLNPGAGIRGSPMVTALARRIHDQPASHNDLKEALIAANDADLAEHFRDPQVHPRGCWALDLILGRR
jgi:hypothetical protein